MMNPPTSLNRCLAIGMLRTVGISSKETARLVRCADQTVADVENWIRKEEYSSIAGLFKDQDIKQMVARELVYLEIEEANIARLAQLTGGDILREYRRAEYLQRERTPDSRALKHFDDLAEVTKTLEDIQKCLLSYEDNEVYTVGETHPDSGMWYFSPMPKKRPTLPTFAGSCAPIDYPEIEYLLRHLLQEFSGLDLKDWKELVTNKLPKDVVERLSYLGNTAKFKYCPTCQVCKDLMMYLRGMCWLLRCIGR